MNKRNQKKKKKESTSTFWFSGDMESGISFTGNKFSSSRHNKFNKFSKSRVVILTVILIMKRDENSNVSANCLEI